MVKVNVGGLYIHVANPLDAWDGAQQGAFLFQFGAHGSVYILVFVAPSLRSLDDCLEEAADTLEEVAPGVFVEPDYESDGDDAEADLTYTEAGWIPSWEWFVDELTPGASFFGQLLGETILADADAFDIIDDYPFDEVYHILNDAGVPADLLDEIMGEHQGND